MKTSRLIDTILNVFSLLAVVLIVFVLSNRYVFGVKEERASVEGPQRGTTIVLPAVNWAESPRTLVLALSVNCRYCSESAEFYRRLLKTTSPNPWRAIAVFPQPASEAQSYLQSHGLVPDEIVQARLAQIGVKATPSLLLVDDHGRVQSSWVGRLSSDREVEVFKEIGAVIPGEDANGGEAGDGAQTPSDPNMISAVELKGFLEKEAVLPVVDIRPRKEYAAGHIAGSLCVPLDELPSRARHEVPKWPTVILYCNSCSACDGNVGGKGLTTLCTMGGFMMKRFGFERVKLVGEDLSKLKQAGITIIDGAGSR